MKEITKGIYSLQYPETRKMISDLWEEKPHYLFDDSYKRKQDGKEVLFFKEFKKWTKQYINLNEYKLFYPTAGSSEAIREVIWSLKKNNKRLVLFENDYEGYLAFAKSTNIELLIINREEYSTYNYQINDVFIFSNPSSIDGKFWNKYNDFITFLENHKIKCYIDLCYVGCCPEMQKINLNNNVVLGCFISLSKSYGVYYHRIGGLITNQVELGLVGNQWFKNMFSLELGIKLMQKYPIEFLPKKYFNIKNKINEKIEKEMGIKIIENDVILFIISNDVLDEYKRGSISRICITPMIDKIIKKETI